MVPAAIIILIVGLALCGAVAVLWLDRDSAVGRVSNAVEQFGRESKALEFEVDRLKKWTKMSEDYRGGSGTSTP